MVLKKFVEYSKGRVPIINYFCFSLMMRKLTEVSVIAILLAGALPVLAQTPSSPTSATAPTATAAPASASASAKLDTACMQSAVGKRDTALISVVDTYATAVKNALQTRSDALKTAWGNTDAKTRRAAIKAAWKTYQTTQQTSRRALVAGRKGVWNQFYADRKACGRGAAAEDSATAGMDAGL